MLNCEHFLIFNDRKDVTLTAYVWEDSVELLDGKKRPAVLICPGGAYKWCGDREGEPVALAFAAMGYNTFVLRYSLREKALFPQPMRDIAKAMEFINDRAKEWFVDVENIALCGFSAGGHNVAMYSNYYDKDIIVSYINRDDIVLKPKACILGYPLTDYVYMNEMVKKSAKDLEYFEESNGYFLGKDWDNEETLTKVSPARLVTKSTPPTFIWTTANDNMVPCQHSSIYATALAEKKIPFELHIF